MSPKKRKKLSQAHRRALVARLFLQGKFQHEIATEAGCTQGTVSKDLEVIRKAWAESPLIDFNEAVQRELQRLDLYERELWEAWERSKKPVVKKDTRVKGVSAKASDYEITPDGIIQESKGQQRKHYPLETQKRETTYERDGNPLFMRLLLQVSRDRVELLMLAIPEGDEDMGTAQSFFDALVASAEAAWSGVEEAEWEEVEGEDEGSAGGDDDPPSHFKLLGD